MEESNELVYQDEICAKIYRKWSSYGVNTGMIDQVTFEYFGDLKAAKVADFGCGKGSFLRKCLTKKASFCMGIDINESMINSGRKPDDPNSTRLRFEIINCFKPMDQAPNQFDFALSHFFLHVCSSETELEIFFKNVINMLKPGGKMFIGQNPFVANTFKDQEIVTNLCGHLQPMLKDSAGQDPFFVAVPAFHPAPHTISKTGRPFTREQIFTFPDYYWSKEKVIKSLVKTGFINIELLPPSFPADVPEFEQEQIRCLEEPFMLIGAEKPKMRL